MIDGYCIYKDKLITYYQTDSMDRASIIDAKYLLKFSGKIKNYESTHSNNVIFEPKQELYEIVGNGKLSFISNQSELKFNRDNITGRNVIKNENVNKLLNSYIQNNVNVLYELRFVIKNNKRYATLRSMIFYDKDKYDGYFYRNGYLVVLCRVQQQMQNYSKKLKNLHFGVSKFNFSLGLELSLYCTFLMYRSV